MNKLENWTKYSWTKINEVIDEVMELKGKIDWLWKFHHAHDAVNKAIVPHKQTQESEIELMKCGYCGKLTSLGINHKCLQDKKEPNDLKTAYNAGYLNGKRDAENEPKCSEYELSERLHRARHTNSGLSEEQAKINWNQHSTASQLKVWGGVADEAKQWALEQIDKQIRRDKGVNVGAFGSGSSVASLGFINWKELIAKIKEN